MGVSLVSGNPPAKVPSSHTDRVCWPRASDDQSADPSTPCTETCQRMLLRRARLEPYCSGVSLRVAWIGIRRPFAEPCSKMDHPCVENVPGPQASWLHVS